MAGEQTVAASSPADVFNGETPTLAEFNSWRESGQVPERFKPAEHAGTAPADAPEETAPEGEQPESASEPGSDDVAQEPPQKKHLSAEQRRAQIRATIEQLWAADEPDVIRIAQLEATDDRIAQRAGLKRKAEPAPASPAPAQQTVVDKEPTPEDTNADGTAKFKTYEDFVRAQANWAADQRIAAFIRHQQDQEAARALQEKIDAATSLYGDAANFNVMDEVAGKILDAPIAPVVKEIFGKSEYLPHLCYVLSDPEESAKFLALAQKNPRAALEKVFEYEKGIKEELSKTATAPEKKKTTAPPPPSPVGATSTRAFDVNDDSLTPEQWMRKRNEQVARRK